MKILNGKKAQLIHSLIWAAIMLGAAYFWQDDDFFLTLFIFIVGGWYITSLFVTKQPCKQKNCCVRQVTTTKDL